MTVITVKLAGLAIEIHDTYDSLPASIVDFKTDEQPEFCIDTIRHDVTYKDKNENGSGVQGFHFDSSLFGFLERLYDRMIDFDILVFHSAVISLDGLSYAFTAPSGTGKTTHIQKWLSYLPEAFVVNGDKPFIKFEKAISRPIACGSPWAGKENMYTNTTVPLKAIILMERAENNYIKQIGFAEAFPFLLEQTYHPNNEEKMRRTLRLMQRLSPSVTFWRFQCNNFKADCFDVVFNALVRNRS